MDEQNKNRDVIPREIAQRAGCNVTKVLGWIRSGELVAYNVAASGKRPRWRITEAAWEEFKRKRSNVPHAETRHPKRKRATSVKEYV